MPNIVDNNGQYKITIPKDLIEDENRLVVLIKSKAIQNKANKELLTLLKKRLNLSINQIQIISGSKTRDKTIKISLLENKSIEDIYKSLINK